MKKTKGSWCLLALLLSSCFSSCLHDTFTTTSDGVRLAYEYHRAAPEKGTAVLLHGLGSNLDEWYTLRGFLNENGWSTLSFDFRGHAMSLYMKDKEIQWQQLSMTGIRSMEKDIEAAVKLLANDRNVWLMGSSIGANLALIYAAAHPGVKGLILLSPGKNYGGLEALPALEGYGKRPVLFAASEDDPGSAKVAEQLREKAWGENKLLIYQKAGHGSAMLEVEKELKKEILGWMNQHSN